MDTFPGLQQDALDAIRKANAVILKARELRAHCASGNLVEVREACKAISEAGKDIGDFCEAFALTTDHFVAYDE